VCKTSLSNDYTGRVNLIGHAERCDRYIGDGTCPKILPCCNRSSLEMMNQNKWTALKSFANHIKHCGGTTKPHGKRDPTSKDNTKNVNPNRLNEYM
jgi:hypothetical protein